MDINIQKTHFTRKKIHQKYKRIGHQKDLFNIKISYIYVQHIKVIDTNSQEDQH